jgi:outer membrane assembly lipoprotein YfiO
MKINRYQKLIAFVCLFLLTACATKDHSPDSFKQFTSKQILAQGEQALSKKNYDDAIKCFEAIDALYPFDQEVKQGQLDVIYAYYKAGNYPAALAAASRYIHLYPEDSSVDYAYYMKGRINFDRDQTLLQKTSWWKTEELDVSNLNSAYVDFSELLVKFPGSKYAKDARRRMIYICNIAAEHELRIAKFYLDRKAYVAAINRASNLVKHYGRALQVKEALQIMMVAYQALGLDEQAKETRLIFNENFPASSS